MNGEAFALPTSFFPPVFFAWLVFTTVQPVMYQRYTVHERVLYFNFLEKGNIFSLFKVVRLSA